MDYMYLEKLREIYYVEKAYAKKYKIVLPEIMAVDYSEEVIQLSAKEQREEDDWRIKHNQISEADVLFRDDPDKYSTIEKAEKQIEKNKKMKGVKSIMEDELNPEPKTEEDED